MEWADGHLSKKLEWMDWTRVDGYPLLLGKDGCAKSDEFSKKSLTIFKYVSSVFKETATRAHLKEIGFEADFC